MLVMSDSMSIVINVSSQCLVGHLQVVVVQLNVQKVVHANGSPLYVVELYLFPAFLRSPELFS